MTDRRPTLSPEDEAKAIRRCVEAMRDGVARAEIDRRFTHAVVTAASAVVGRRTGGGRLPLGLP